MQKYPSQEPTRPIPPSGLLTALPWLILVAFLTSDGWLGNQSAGWAVVCASEKAGGGSKSKDKVPPAPSKMAVPLVSSQVSYVPRVPGKEQSVDMIVPVDPKASPRIIVQLADIKTIHHAMARISLSAQNTDLLIRRFNAKQPGLYEALTQRIKDKTIKDTQSSGFRSQLRSEMLYDCNKLLGSNVVQEIIISEFVVR